jgi:hypothetical protein
LPVGEIQIQIIPSGNGATPVVDSWTITYSCVDSE